MNAEDRLKHLFKRFQDEQQTDDLILFGEWLKQYHESPDQYLTREKTVNAIGPRVIASYTIGSIGNYANMWMRLAMKDEPIEGQMDWSIIKKVEELGNPTKKEITAESIAERTSCVEAVKRLVRKGILKETPHESDKRSKRVQLTPLGKETIKQLNIKMRNLGNLLVGSITESEARSIVPVLKKLVQFHTQLSKTKERESIKREYMI